MDVPLVLLILFLFLPVFAQPDYNASHAGYN